MPYSVATNRSDCSGFAVVKDSNAKLMGCHKTRAAAGRQIAALYASEGADMQKATKTDSGEEYPAKAYAYVPDPDKPSSWKLRLWQTPEMKVTRRQVGLAVAALGKGYRGQRARIPAADLPAVKANVLRAWLEMHPEMERSDAPRVLLASRITARTPADEVGKRLVGKDSGEGGYQQDAMTLLLMAYRSLLDSPECESLLDPLMELIHAKQEIMVDMLGMDMADDELDFTPGATYSNVEEGKGKRRRQYRRDTEISLERIARASLSQLTKWMNGFDMMGNTANVEAMRQFVRAEIQTRVSKAGMVVEKADAKRYTLGPVYVPGVLDAHGEFTDDDTLQEALWGWMKKDDRSIYLQHSETKAGEFVELLTWPFPITAAMSLPGEEDRSFDFPANTPFMGVIWEPWAWDLVQNGDLRGYSIGGTARRMEAALVEPAVV
tara:strand:- start:65 stop:1372 length:1308 start_codon:yes stop_codon:yes gene_type:complete